MNTVFSEPLESVLCDELSFFSLAKMEALAIFLALQTWITAFLSHHQMRVGVAYEFSPLVSMTNGVLQGLVLGPLLFLILVNHYS